MVKVGFLVALAYVLGACSTVQATPIVEEPQESAIGWVTHLCKETPTRQGRSILYCIDVDTGAEVSLMYVRQSAAGV